MPATIQMGENDIQVHNPNAMATSKQKITIDHCTSFKLVATVISMTKLDSVNVASSGMAILTDSSKGTHSSSGIFQPPRNFFGLGGFRSWLRSSRGHFYPRYERIKIFAIKLPEYGLHTAMQRITKLITLQKAKVTA